MTRATTATLRPGRSELHDVRGLDLRGQSARILSHDNGAVEGRVAERVVLATLGLHRPAHMPSPPPRPSPPKVRPPRPPLPPPPLLSFTGRFATLPWAFTPLMTCSSCVSTTTPPTIISPSVACRVSKLKIKSSSHTFSKRPSSAWTKTWIRSRSARGDSVDVLMTIK
jgi:hypothetical protein